MSGKKDLLLDESIIRHWGKLAGQDKMLVENYLKEMAEEENYQDPSQTGLEGDPSMQDVEGEVEGEVESAGEVSIDLSPEAAEVLIDLGKQLEQAQTDTDDMDLEEPGLESDIGMDDQFADESYGTVGGSQPQLGESKKLSIEEEVAEELSQSIFESMSRERKKKELLKTIDYKSLTERIKKRLQKELK